MERPILRFPDPENSSRRKNQPNRQPRPSRQELQQQGKRFQATFDRLSKALTGSDPITTLRHDPSGIAPERALVFVTIGRISEFSRAAREAGLEVLSEEDVESSNDFELPPSTEIEAPEQKQVLYATIPTIASLQQMLSLWGAYQDGSKAPKGAAPWWRAFDHLSELRTWGPQDRIGLETRNILNERLAHLADDAPVAIEFEIWPTANATNRATWISELEQRVADHQGSVLDRSSISEVGFVYEALLSEFPAVSVRDMLSDPSAINGLATLDGVQFILPQTIGQAIPDGSESIVEHRPVKGTFVENVPIRAALLDGTPVAAHPYLDGGIVVEDMHDLVRLSAVAQRSHATAMASLILRGDLNADGIPLGDTKLVCVPILIDEVHEARSASNRLFVDTVHTTLVQLVSGDDPVAPDVFVVNFSIGTRDGHFAGRISALARLLDWWSAKEGLLFVISAGNVGSLVLPGRRMSEVEDLEIASRKAAARSALREAIASRTLLAPAESLNAITVGALSMDLDGNSPQPQAGMLRLENDGEYLPQLTSALGLGSRRCIKPDILEAGGCMEVRAIPSGDHVSLQAPKSSSRTGLVVASPAAGNAIQRTRGTSPAAALVTRSLLQTAEALTGPDGPYEGRELSRRENALLTRALAINAARWPQDAIELYDEELARLPQKYSQAKAEVCRHYGYGCLDRNLMRQSPEGGVTMVGLGSIRKDGANIFRMPVPPSISGERLPRSMRVTLAWFSPINPARAQYRLANMEAALLSESSETDDKRWGFDMEPEGPDLHLIKKGSVWSRRLKGRVQTIPQFPEDSEIGIRVQCTDASGGGLNPDEDIMFSIAVTLQIESQISFDILQEIRQALTVRLNQANV